MLSTHIDRRMTDQDWLSQLEKSVLDSNVGLPGFPSKELQAQWVGNAGIATLREAFTLYQLIKERPGFPDGPILDFGIGWGRVARFFLKDMSPTEIFGVDTNEWILEECRRLGVPARLAYIDPTGHLPYEDNTFTTVFAYSVFTHLAESSANHWASEIRRVLKPGGQFVFTLVGETILQGDIAAANHARFGDPVEAMRRYRNSEFVFKKEHAEDDLYGWAAVPPDYISSNWKFQFEKFVADLGYKQSACVLVK